MTILETAITAFAAKLDEGVANAVAAAILPLAGEVDALEARVAELEASAMTPEAVDERIAAALDAVAHRMFTEDHQLPFSLTET